MHVIKNAEPFQRPEFGCIFIVWLGVKLVKKMVIVRASIYRMTALNEFETFLIFDMY